jgi:glycosyltransferase involved in cell wall biosynthesis
MRFSVCIPATRASSLAGAIRAIQAQTVTDWELLVVGQAGVDHGVRQVVEAVAEFDGRVRYLHIDRPGSSRARNAAMRAASGEIVAMTDDDCEARPDWLAVLGRVMTDEPGVALVGGALVAPPAAPVRPARCPSFAPAEILYDPVARGRRPPAGWDWIGANFALRRHVAERLGDFDEHLGVGADFPSAGDSDYKLRLEAGGFKMRSTPRAVVVHTHGWRYGVPAVLALQRRHARGFGGLAGKLTLLGHPRAKEWREMAQRERLMRWLRRRQPQRLATDLRVLWHFRDAYYECLRHYGVNARGLLYRRNGIHASDEAFVLAGTGQSRALSR